MLYFAELRSLLSKTDAIQIIFPDKNEEKPYENYLTIEHVPDKYNLYEVLGIGSNKTIETDYGIIMNGTEILLKEPLNFSLPVNNAVGNEVKNTVTNMLNGLGGIEKWI